MAEEKKLYLVNSPIQADKDYSAGDFIHLTDAEAEALLKVNVVSLHETDSAPETDDVPLTSLSKAQLQELATKMNLTVPGNATKDAIIAAIATARAEEK